MTEGSAPKRPRLWMRVGPIGVVTASVIHAADSPRPKSKRKTWDTACGKRASLYVHPTTDGDSITIAWPPPVKDARDWGYARCRDCMTARPGPVCHPAYAADRPDAS